MGGTGTTRIGATGMLAVDGPITVALDTRTLDNRGGTVYAVQAACPHKGGPLADGLVGGTTLICPLHSWKFDLATGQALFGDCGIRTFPVRIDEAEQIILLHNE